MFTHFVLALANRINNTREVLVTKMQDIMNIITGLEC